MFTSTTFKKHFSSSRSCSVFLLLTVFRHSDDGSAILLINLYGQCQPDHTHTLPPHPPPHTHTPPHTHHLKTTAYKHGTDVVEPSFQTRRTIGQLHILMDLLYRLCLCYQLQLIEQNMYVLLQLLNVIICLCVIIRST